MFRLIAGFNKGLAMSWYMVWASARADKHHQHATIKWSGLWWLIRLSLVGAEFSSKLGWHSCFLSSLLFSFTPTNSITCVSQLG